MEALVPRLSDNGLIHIVGLSPIYALLGDSAYKKLSDAEKLVVDTVSIF